MLRPTAEQMTGFLVGLGSVGIMLASWLVVSETFIRPTCPLLLGLPACYIVLVAYLLATLGAARFRHRAGDASFLLGTGVILAIAAYGSWSQLRGTVQCPSFEGLPMCFGSLSFGAILLAGDQVRRRLPSHSTGRAS